jgi:sugar lactone lactonase YvrE
LVKNQYFTLLAAAALCSVPAFAGTIYFDTATTLYTLDQTSGTVTQLATGFTGARGIAVGSDGNLYVADYGAGELDQVVGSTINPYATISGAYGVVADGNNLLVSTFTSTGDIVTVTAADTFTTMVTPYGNLTDLTFGPNGDLYFGAQSASSVIQWDGTNYSTYVSLAGDGGTVPTPRGLSFDGSGNLYVADSASLNGFGSGVYKFDGMVLSKLTPAGAVKGLGLDSDSNTLYFADNINGGIYSEAITGGAPTVVASISGPQELFVDPTPEPGTMALFGLGLAVVGVCRRVRRA